MKVVIVQKEHKMKTFLIIKKLRRIRILSNMKKKNFNQIKLEYNEGITLIALIVSIIIIIILAVVSISAISSQDGIINKAQNATNDYYEEGIKEQIKLQLTKEQLIKSANQERILWQSPFHYQLLTSIYQNEIEQKLGRKYETTDFFYEVNSELLDDIDK